MIKQLVLGLVLSSVLSVSHTNAATVYMDISDQAGFVRLGASGTQGNGYLWITPQYFFEPGTTVDFGFASVIGDPTDYRTGCDGPGRGPCFAANGFYRSYLLTDGMGGLDRYQELGGASAGCITTTGTCAPDIFRLLLTLGPDNDGVQLAFQGSSLKITPVPLPATLLLFLVGLGLVGLRRVS